MDVTKQVDSIVSNLVRDIESGVNSRIDNLIIQALTKRLEDFDYEKKINYLASIKLDGVIANMNVDQERVQARLNEVADTVVNNFDGEARRLATDHVRTKLHNDIDINAVVREIILVEISKKLSTFNFPRNSIPGEAVDSRKLEISGNNIKGGIIKNFSSSGIDDRSTEVQMTLLDQGVVVENKIIALGLEVKGQVVIEGDLHIKGKVPMENEFFKTLVDNAVEATRTSLGPDIFEGFSNTIFERIRENGLDLTKITLDGNEVITGNKLSYGVTDTNINRLGMVKDLQTTGESYFSQTLYVGDKRVGINTLEPGHAFSVWDQEVEIGFGKRERDVAWVGTPREQSVVLSSNRKDNLVLNKDGSVSIQKLYIGQVELGTSEATPNDSAPKGSVRFNSNPNPGGPAGWISLGGGAWSRFGTLG
jgi:hypothetical protein